MQRPGRKSSEPLGATVGKCFATSDNSSSKRIIEFGEEAGADTELDNELAMADDCRHHLFRETERWLHRLLAWMVLELRVPQSRGGNKDPFKVRSQLKWSGLGWNDRDATILKRLVRLLVRLVLPIYFLVKFCALTCLQTRYDQLLRQAHLVDLPLNACLSTEAPSGARELKLLEQITRTREQLERIGSPYIDMPGMGLAFHNTAILYPLILCVLVWLACQLGEVRLDWLAFLLQPQEESQRLALERDRMLANLFVSVHQRPSQLDSRSFAGLHLRPANATRRWHKRMLLIMRRVARSMSLILIAFNSIAFISLFLAISYFGLTTRLRQLACLRRHSHQHHQHQFATINHLFLKGTNPADLNDYQQYDGSSWSHFLYLLVWVEPKYRLGGRNLLTWCEINLAICLSTFWFLALFLLYLMSVLDRLVWLRQLHGQLLVLIRLAQLGDARRLLKLSPGVYLNYALFRSQFAAFHRSASLAVLQATLCTCCTLWYVFLAKRNMGASVYRLGLVFIGFLHFFVGLNGYFAIFSYLFARIERLMERIVELLATIELTWAPARQLAHPNSLRLNFWRAMWYRQLMDGRELATFYGLTLFAVQISFASLIQVNVYPTAILTYLA